MIFLSSCKNAPEIKPQEICTISFKFNKCRCHYIDDTPNGFKRLGESYDISLGACEGLLGMRPETQKTVLPWMDEVLFWINDL